jgi:hypothetical protein
MMEMNNRILTIGILIVFLATAFTGIIAETDDSDAYAIKPGYDPSIPNIGIDRNNKTDVLFQNILLISYTYDYNSHFNVPGSGNGWYRTDKIETIFLIHNAEYLLLKSGKIIQGVPTIDPEFPYDKDKNMSYEITTEGKYDIDRLRFLFETRGLLLPEISDILDEREQMQKDGTYPNPSNDDISTNPQYIGAGIALAVIIGLIALYAIIHRKSK